MVQYSNFSLEYEFLNNGCASVAGLDEVGRGCYAGPVVAAVVVISSKEQYIPGVWDSKQMTQLRREKFYDQIIDSADDHGIGEASWTEVDDLGLSEASSLAMQRAYDSLRKPPELVLVDGKFIKSPNLPNKYKIKEGDKKHFIISAASVIAKVYRDRLMVDFAKKYKGYGFERNVGYGTAEHKAALDKYGVCEIHRKSFSPIKKLLESGENGAEA